MVFGPGHEASHYYSMLLRCPDNSTSALTAVWESYLGTLFTENEWTLLLRHLKKMSRDLKSRCIQFKILNRVYWTPSKLYKVKQRNNSTSAEVERALWCTCLEVMHFFAIDHANLHALREPIGMNVHTVLGRN